MVSLLIDKKSDLSLTNNNGFNPIHHAALRGNPRLVRRVGDEVRREGVKERVKEGESEGGSEGGSEEGRE